MVVLRVKAIVVGGHERNRSSRREIVMRICTIIISVLAVSVLFVALLGCAKKENRSREESSTNSEPDAQSAAEINKSKEITSQASTADIPARPEDAVAEDDEEGLGRQVDEVRMVFLSLQQVCKANDIDGYLAVWDDETKMVVDGRDLDVDERRMGIVHHRITRVLSLIWACGGLVPRHRSRALGPGGKVEAV